MGSIYSDTLPEFLEKWGIPFSFYDDKWARRSRSSGGWAQIWGIGIHHDASSPSTTVKQSCDYMWLNASDRPIGNCLLDRTGHVTLGAGGASNTQGKGGPLMVSRGTIPQDQGNTYLYSIEAANNGLGEPWPEIQQQNYLALCSAIIDWCHSIGQPITTDDVVAHFVWAPSRKIDPAGQSFWAIGSAKWNMEMFRIDLSEYYHRSEDDLPYTKDELKEIVREVFNEMAIFGSDGTYQQSFQIMNDHINQTFNNTEVIKRQTSPPTE